MMSSPVVVPLSALLIMDDDADALPIIKHLRSAGYALHQCRVATLAELQRALADEPWDVVISDFNLPNLSTLAALATVRRCAGNTPFVIVSDVIAEEQACNFMHAGALDCLGQARLNRLAPLIERERRAAQMRVERSDAITAVRVGDARFSAMAANVPGVLFQLEVGADNHLRFLYVSEASQMLLGMPAENLLSRADLLLELMMADDRQSFFAALAEASRRHNTVNWEGRIELEPDDVKWINIRCSPRTSEAAGLTLWEGVMWNITQSKVAEAELRSSRKQLAELSEHLHRVKEQERERIARDIHDVLGGTLVGIKIATSLLAGKMGHDAVLECRVREIEQMLDDAITIAGRVARELRPGILKEFGLAAAIESYAADFHHRTSIPCVVLCADHDIDTDENTALALFRTYQEALTNVGKHAQASKVEVRLMQEGEDIVLEVADDGRGIDFRDLAKPKSFGLRSIRERLHMLGGSMDVGSRQGRGTMVVLRAPIAGQACNEIAASSVLRLDRSSR